MSRTVPSWLDDPVCLVVGEGAGVEAIAHELAAAGATIARAPVAATLDKAAISLAGAEEAACDPVALLVHSIAQIEEREAVTSAAYFTECLAALSRERNIAASVLFLSDSETRSITALRQLTADQSRQWSQGGTRANGIYTRLLSGGTKLELRSLGALAAYLLSPYARHVSGCAMSVDDVAE